MKKQIITIVSKCKQCPFYGWTAKSSVNIDIFGFCKKKNMVIEHGNKNPEIPKWCPLNNYIKPKKSTKTNYSGSPYDLSDLNHPANLIQKRSVK